MAGGRRGKRRLCRGSTHSSTGHGDGWPRPDSRRRGSTGWLLGQPRADRLARDRGACPGGKTARRHGAGASRSNEGGSTRARSCCTTQAERPRELRGPRGHARVRRRRAGPPFNVGAAPLAPTPLLRQFEEQAARRGLEPGAAWPERLGAQASPVPSAHKPLVRPSSPGTRFRSRHVTLTAPRQRHVTPSAPRRG